VETKSKIITGNLQPIVPPIKGIEQMALILE
jgi:hypothetical protein